MADSGPIESTSGSHASPRAAGPWSAVVLAGSRPEPDAVAAHFGVAMKALVPVAGEAMVIRVVRTLLQSPSIDRILLLAQDPARLQEGDLAWMAREPRISFAAGEASIAGSLSQVLGTAAAPWPALVTTGDHPLLTPEMVEFFIERSGGADLSVGVVERDLLLARYPDNRRTWLRFRRGAFTGANLFTLQTERAAAALAGFAGMESDRKKRLRLLWHFGPSLALGAATRTISLEEGVARAGRGLGIEAKAVPLPFPDAGIDVDRLDDHHLVERILAERREQAAPANGKVAVSIFDLDRTLTRRGTFTAFLLYAARRRAPWRLLLAPAALMQFAGYAVGMIDRKQLKERLQQMFLGRSVPRREIAELAAAYARRLRKRGFNRQGISQIAEERAQGRRVVLATAANAFYVSAIARELAVDEVVCTQSAWDGDRLLARIEGQNCYGEDKLAMLKAHLERPETPRWAMHVRFFSDHRSDACVLGWADQAFVVNPAANFRVQAAQMGWPVLSWL